jgi:hypothetical protein
VFAEIGECASRMRGLVDGPSAQKYLGPCGAWVRLPGDVTLDGVPIETPCEGDVYGYRGAPTGTCRTCGTQVDQAERSAWLDAEVRQHSYRASEIEDAYGVPAGQIRVWAARGQLAVHDHDLQERARYMLGDVLDLAAAQAVRREEKRAERARRAAARAAGSEDAA